MILTKYFRSLIFVSLFGWGINKAQAISWKAIFVSGDDSIQNFDNGREELAKLFSSRGQLQSHQFSSSRDYISQEQGIMAATGENLAAYFNQLKLNAEEGCFIHMTSHGSRGRGFYLSMSGMLSPETLAHWVNKACGTAPTIILVSACYSGQFITENLKGSNRVILTAARSDRPSFGCSPDTRYTYWDGCMIDELPRSNSWPELYANINSCITTKESQAGMNPSEPQAFFGDGTKEWGILH